MKIVQLGAGWGDDHVTDLVKSSAGIDFLLLVEPNPKVQSRLRECYGGLPNTWIEQVAVVANYDEGTEMDMFFTEHDRMGGYQITSLIKNHVIKHNYAEEFIQTFRTKCTTISDLFSKYSITELDYLFIDIEGVDDAVLFSIDLNKYNIKHICIEEIHLPSLDKVCTFLEAYGYKSTGEVYNLFDRMFIKQ